MEKAKETLDKIKEQIDALFEAVEVGDMAEAYQILLYLAALLAIAAVILAAWITPVVPPCPP